MQKKNHSIAAMANTIDALFYFFFSLHSNFFGQDNALHNIPQRSMFI